MLLEFHYYHLYFSHFSKYNIDSAPVSFVPDVHHSRVQTSQGQTQIHLPMPPEQQLRHPRSMPLDCHLDSFSYDVSSTFLYRTSVWVTWHLAVPRVILTRIQYTTKLHSWPNTVIYNGFNNSGQKKITSAFSALLLWIDIKILLLLLSLFLFLSHTFLVPGECLLALGLKPVLPFPCPCSVLAAFSMLA